LWSLGGGIQLVNIYAYSVPGFNVAPTAAAAAGDVSKPLAAGDVSKPFETIKSHLEFDDVDEEAQGGRSRSSDASSADGGDGGMLTPSSLHKTDTITAAAAATTIMDKATGLQSFFPRKRISLVKANSGGRHPRSKKGGSSSSSIGGGGGGGGGQLGDISVVHGGGGGSMDGGVGGVAAPHFPPAAGPGVALVAGGEPPPTYEERVEACKVLRLMVLEGSNNDAEFRFPTLQGQAQPNVYETILRAMKKVVPQGMYFVLSDFLTGVFLSFVRSFVLLFVRSFVLSFFRSFVLSFFRSFILSFLPVYFSFFLSYQYISFFLSCRCISFFLSYRYISFFLSFLPQGLLNAIMDGGKVGVSTYDSAVEGHQLIWNHECREIFFAEIRRCITKLHDDKEDGRYVQRNSPLYYQHTAHTHIQSCARQ
jgi:hypothetical protein